MDDGRGHQHHHHHHHPSPTAGGAQPAQQQQLLQQQMPSSPQPQQHQRRRSALEGAAALAPPLVVGPGGLALINLGMPGGGVNAAAAGGGSPVRQLRGLSGSGSGSGSGSSSSAAGGFGSPSRLGSAAAAGGGGGGGGPLGGASPLSAYALRVMRERAASSASSSASAAAALEEKGESETMTGAVAGSPVTRPSGGGLASFAYASPPPPSRSPVASNGAVIRSVDDDEEAEAEGAAAGHTAHACRDGTHPPSSLGASPSMCCRNCGSNEVVKTVPLSAAFPAKEDSNNKAGGGLGRSPGGAGTAALRAASLASGLPVSICKLLVVGNAKCGKTSVIRRFVQGSFDNAYNSTVGADYLKRDVVLKDGRPVRLQLWDIAGQDRFVHLTRAYFARARGVLLVCDLTREKTFEAVRAWKREIDEWALTEARGEGVGPLPVVLIANKCDMLTDAADSFLAGANMVAMCHEQNFASWYVTSARTGSNVEAAFIDLVERAVAFMDRQEEAAKAAAAAAGGKAGGGGDGSSSGFKLSSVDGQNVGSGSGSSLWSVC